MSLEKRAVVALVNYNDKVLVGKKNCDDLDGFLCGKWHIPDETIEGDESDEMGLVRGIKEEADIIIKPGRYLAFH